MADKTAVIAKIREHYSARGIPLDDLSDRDIEQGVRQLAYAAREAGTGSKEAEDAMRMAVEVAKRQKEERAAEAAAAADAADLADAAGGEPPEQGA
jgi:hypothetical protein